MAKKLPMVIRDKREEAKKKRFKNSSKVEKPKVKIEKETSCNHKIKRIFSHGRNSKPRWVCRKCKCLLERYVIAKQKNYGNK